MSKKIIGWALLGSSVWGAGIHSDHNGVNVTHQEWIDPDPSDDGEKPTYLPHGHYYSMMQVKRQPLFTFKMDQ